jgi:hypothetical protein
MFEEVAQNRSRWRTFWPEELRFPILGIIDIILFVCVLSSVRGTFAYRKLIRAGSGPRAA